MMTRWIILAIALGGCPQREPVSPSLTPADAAACNNVATHMLELMRSDGAAPETIDALRHAISGRCSGDKWTLDAVQCFSDAKLLEATDHCAELLTVDQRNAFDRALGDALGARK